MSVHTRWHTQHSDVGNESWLMRNARCDHSASTTILRLFLSRRCMPRCVDRRQSGTTAGGIASRATWSSATLIYDGTGDHPQSTIGDLAPAERPAQSTPGRNHGLHASRGPCSMPQTMHKPTSDVYIRLPAQRSRNLTDSVTLSHLTSCRCRQALTNSL